MQHGPRRLLPLIIEINIANGNHLLTPPPLLNGLRKALRRQHLKVVWYTIQRWHTSLSIWPTIWLLRIAFQVTGQMQQIRSYLYFCGHSSAWDLVTGLGPLLSPLEAASSVVLLFARKPSPSVQAFAVDVIAPGDSQPTQPGLVLPWGCVCRLVTKYEATSKAFN